MPSIVKKYITQNDCYKQGRTIVPKGIIIHSLGVPQPNADIIINSWNAPRIKKAVHAIIETERIIQLMPWNYRCWGCGSGSNGSGNNDYIQFEICEPSGFKYGYGSTMIGYDAEKQQSYFDSVWANAVDLAVYLCKIYKLSPDTIICHSEAHTKGIASNHADVMHWFPKHRQSMDTFRKAVKEKMNYTPDSTITVNSSERDIKWLQSQLNKANKNYNIPVDGDYGQKTRISLLMFAADVKGWNWSNTWGYVAKKATIESLSKY